MASRIVAGMTAEQLASRSTKACVKRPVTLLNAEAKKFSGLWNTVQQRNLITDKEFMEPLPTLLPEEIAEASRAFPAKTAHTYDGLTAPGKKSSRKEQNSFTFCFG